MPKVVKYKTGSMANAKRTFERRYSEKDDTITFEEFLEITQLNCYYCGIEPSNENKHIKRKMDIDTENNTFIYSGVDRFDNTKPHTKQNCVPCCKFCNFSKNDLTFEEFINIHNNRMKKMELK